MRGKTDLDTYIRLKKCVSEIYPQMEIKLISQVSISKEPINYIQCEIELCGTDEQIEELEDIVIQFEIDAYNTPDEQDPPKNDPNFILYNKYTWIADLLYNFYTKGEYVLC